MALAAVLGPKGGGVAFSGLSTLWVDSAGRQTVTLIRNDPTGCPIQAQVILVSAARPLQDWEGVIDQHAPTPAANTYLIGDWAILHYACADGTEASLLVPAPLPSLFMADGRTVDPTSAAALNAAAIGRLASYSGSLATSYLSGYRKTRSP